MGNATYLIEYYNNAIKSDTLEAETDHLDNFAL